MVTLIVTLLGMLGYTAQLMMYLGRIYTQSQSFTPVTGPISQDHHGGTSRHPQRGQSTLNTWRRKESKGEGGGSIITINQRLAKSCAKVE